MPATLRDMVVLLPGISGSVLQKDGKDIWAPSGQALWQVLRTLGNSIRALQLDGDDAVAEDLGDGIRATRVITDVHLIPGLHKIDGYSGLLQLLAGFGAITGTIDSDRPANFFAFPYDWRRDCRANARRLQRFIQQRLPQWRAHSGADDARVILLTHSLGGLIARYYVEVLEGWQDCRALITFGTPHRGSLNALNFLCNGYKALFLELTETLRSFTSVYQLLPIYRAVYSDGTYRRVAEIPDLPGIVQQRAQDALAFHREIEAAVARHQRDQHYCEQFTTIPIVGTRQPTLQRASFAQGQLSVDRQLPEWIDAALDDGDGTVPRLSAIPIELSHEYRDTFVAQRHSSLQNHPGLLDDIRERVRHMQTRGLDKVRGAVAQPERAAAPAISLDLDDLYLSSEPIELRVRLLNLEHVTAPPTATLTSITVPGLRTTQVFVRDGDGWLLQLPYLPPGQYRVSVQATGAGAAQPASVHDVFEVAA
ncbi:esterase/lipase family protein [Kallotenue papyrolyticum]|uniref:esterase/lipase family protein n=1 Tax=Kallotenue papyrolyticum TaxID=1325125 RepID=UPI0004785953|nr:hypothetical protein [Kallotenue papyrolyticum]